MLLFSGSNLPPSLQQVDFETADILEDNVLIQKTAHTKLDQVDIYWRWVPSSEGKRLLIRRATGQDTLYINSVLISFIFKINHFNWRIITLQYCNGFCHTSIWISHRYTCCPLHHEPLSHLPPRPFPLGYHPFIKLPLVIYFTHGNVRVSILFCQIILPSSSPTGPKSLFFMSVSPFCPVHRLIGATFLDSI